MKTLTTLCALAAGAGLLTGCGDSSPKSTPPAADAQTTTTTSPLDYGGALVKAKQTADKTIDVTSINKALQMFNVQEGRYPKTLDELVPGYIPKIPVAPVGYKISYDAAKGEVKAVKQP